MNSISRVDQRLPSHPTPFVGRWDELVQIAELMADPVCQLVTLVGPGGIGKTRLALEALSRLAHNFTHGAYFINLNPLTTPDLLIPALIEALRLQLSTKSDPREQLLSYLAHKTLLLILDNFEHLLDGTPLISELLADAPGVKILITSRQRLNIREEWVFDVRGLPFPVEVSGTQMEDYSAVQLYIQNARRINPDFLLITEAASVARICVLVDGMPLALELASSWSHVLTSAEIAEEIERGLDILETTSRNIPERHRNMRAVMDYSWKLLTEDQRDVFMRLSVFRDGFDRAAAEKIAGATRATLATLVSNSWLRHNARGRYAIHELLMKYGDEQLEVSSIGDSVRDVHSTYYASFIEQRLEDLKGRRQIEALAEISVDFENVRTAWYWAVNHKREDLIQKMLEGLGLFCKMCNREGTMLFRYAAQQFRQESFTDYLRLWGRLVARIVDDTEDLQELLETALQIARRFDDVAEIALCLQRLSCIADYAKQDDAQAKRLLEQSLTYYEQLNDEFGAADVLFDLMTRLMKAIKEGTWEDFNKFGGESLRLRRKIGDRVGTAWSLAPVAHGETRAGHFPEAERLWLERIALGQEIDSPALVALGYAHLSYGVYFFQGDFEKAQTTAQSAFDLGSTLGFSNPVGFALATLGLLASMTEDYEKAQTLAHQAASSTSLAWIISVAAWSSAVAACGLRDYEAVEKFLPVALGFLVEMFGPVGTVAGLSIAASVLAHKGHPARAVEWLALAFTHPVRATGWVEKWPLLVHLRAELEQTLGADVYRAAWKRGQLLDMKTVTAQLMKQFSGEQSSAKERPVEQREILLNERELDILCLVRDGLSNRAIADRLFLAPPTIKWYLREIYSKLGVHSRTQAISRARALHLLI